MEKGGELISDNDFAHRSEHSIEFQVVFLQHIFKNNPFTIIPVLCGPIQTTIHQYSRQAYLEKAKIFLETLKMIIADPGQTTLIVAGVDFSHIGLKFGHRLPADQLEGRSKRHDRSLLNHLAECDAEAFWQESAGVNDEYNVCGFSALACLLEILPPCRGNILDYQIWHEHPTRSAVSFAAVVFR
jgi:AmmeMemoRadiSam system protein B